MWKLLKVLVVIGLVGVAGLVAVGAYVRSQLDPENLRQLVAAKAGEKLGRKVTVGPIQFSWSGEIRVEDLKVMKASGNEPQVSVKVAEVSLALASLLSGGKELSRITLREPVIDLVRNPDGTTDVQDVIDRVTGKTPSPVPAPPAPGAPAGEGAAPTPASGGLVVPRLEIVDGQLQVLDMAGPKSHEVKDLDVRLTPHAPDEIEIDGAAQYNQTPFKVSATYRAGTKQLHLGNIEGKITGYQIKLGPGDLSFAGGIPSLGKTAVVLNGNPGSVQVALGAGGQIQGALELAGVDLSQLRPGISGTADVNVTFQGTPPMPAVNGTFKLHRVEAQVPRMGPEFKLTIPEGELVLDGETMKSQGFQAELMGIQAQPTFQLTQLRTKPQLDLESGAIHADLGKLMSLAPKAQQEKLALLAPAGSVSLKIKVHGDVSDPRISGGMSWEDVSVNVPGTKERAELKKGSFDFLGDRIEVKPASIVFRGAALTMSGLVTEVFKEPHAQLQVAGKGISVEPFLDMMPPKFREMDPKLTADLDVRLDKAGESLDLMGEIKPMAGSVKLGTGEGARIVSFLGGGSITLAGKKVHVKSLPLQVDGNKLTVTAQITHSPEVVELASYQIATKAGTLEGQGKVHLTGEGAPRLEGFEAHGPVDLAALGAGQKVSGPMDVDLALSGPASAVTIDGKARSSELSLRLEGGGALQVTDFGARLKGTAAGMEIPSFSGKTCGGDVTGNARIQPGADPSYEVQLKGVSLSRLRAAMGSEGDMVEGRLAVTFQGKGAGSTLTGSGEAAVKDLQVDMSGNPQVQKGRQSLGGSAGAAKILGGLSGGKLKGFAESRQAELEYYAAVIEELSRPQPLGSLEVPIRAKSGVIDLDPIKNEKIEGRVQVDLGTAALSGEIALMVLGDVTMRDIGLGGTTSLPVPRVDLTKLTLKGKAPPAGIANISSSVAGMGGTGNLQQALQENVKKGVGDFLKKEGKKGKLGVLGKLLGGDEEPAATPAPEEPAAADTGDAPGGKKTGKSVLNGLLGGGDEEKEPGQTPAAESDSPEPSPPPKKENLQKKLLKSLFGGGK